MEVSTNKVLAIAILFVFAGDAVSQQREATVQIIAETSIGGPLRNPGVRLIERTSGRDLGSAFKDGVAEHIPFGSYELKVSSPGFAVYTRRIEIFESKVVLRTPMQTGDFASTGSSRLEGTIETTEAQRAGLWVVLFPLSRSPEDLLECSVDGNGHFSISTARFGTYLLSVIRNHHVLYSQEIFFGKDNPKLKILIGSGETSK